MERLKQWLQKKNGFVLGIRGQLMLFIVGITLLTLGLVWGVITYALTPQYNRTIHDRLSDRARAIVAMIDDSDAPISNRDFGILVLNNDFWQSMNDAFQNHVINVDGCCVDFCDSTLRSLKAYESMYPCLLHESTGAFGGEFGYNLNTSLVIQMRQKLFQQGYLFEIVQAGSSQQMLVGRLSTDGQYGVIVSTSLAQISTAAEVMRSILFPLALVLLILDLLFAMLFSRWFTRPVEKLSVGARQIAAGNYDVQIQVVHRDEIGQLAQDFNHMAAEVKRSAQLEKDILANVSHDLRTPLTLIKGYAETVRDLTGDDDDKRTEQCNIIVDETDRLTTLVNSVMELSKVQNGSEKPNPIEFDMSQLCFEVAGRYDALCDQNHWTLRHDGTRAAQPAGQCVPSHRRGRHRDPAGASPGQRLPRGSGGPRPRYPAGGSALPVRPLLPRPPGRRKSRHRAGAFHYQSDPAAAWVCFWCQQRRGAGIDILV